MTVQSSDCDHVALLMDGLSASEASGETSQLEDSPPSPVETPSAYSADTEDTTDRESSNASTSSSSPLTILDRLRAPPVSSLARKRKVCTNPAPPTGKKRSSGQAIKAAYVPKGITPSQRVSEFPGEQLVVSAGKLFCKACKETICLKRSVVLNHIKSTKHVSGKQTLTMKQARERDLALALERHDAETHRKGETLPEEQKVYRARVVLAFMEAGIPLSKLDCPALRELLEESRFRLAHSRHMMDLVPFVLQEEVSRTKREISGKLVSIIFDGTTRLGEVLVVVLRYIQDWEVKQRLVRVDFLQKSLNAEELARQIISAVCVTLSIENNNLVAVMRDGASVNAAAMRTLKIIYPKALDVRCISHTLDLIGDKFKVPTLSLFFTIWISYFSHSAKLKALWKARTGQSIATYSQTRWWSRWEVMNQAFMMFGDIEPFLRENDDASPATRMKLLEFFNDRQKLFLLKLELAVIVDVGAHFVKATYTLEGDGILALICYDRILEIRAAIRSSYHPNVQAIVREAFPNNLPLQSQWINYAVMCVKPGIDYFNSNLHDDGVIKAFKAARLFSPHRLSEMQPSATDIDILSAFPFFDSGCVVALQAELPTYLSLSADVSSGIDILKWWKDHHEELPKWSAAALSVFLVQPSSAAAERVFSLLKSSFGEQQQSALHDLVTATLMVQYNRSFM